MTFSIHESPDHMGDRWDAMTPGQRERELVMAHKARVKNPSHCLGVHGTHDLVWFDLRGKLQRASFKTRSLAEARAETLAEELTPRTTKPGR